MLVLGVEDIGALAADEARELEPGPEREERALQDALGQHGAAGRALEREGEAPDDEARALLDGGRSVIGRGDHHLRPAPREGGGERLRAPFRAARGMRREILVGETDLHAAATSRTDT